MDTGKGFHSNSVARVDNNSKNQTTFGRQERFEDKS